jgi:hypothetical protein
MESLIRLPGLRHRLEYANSVRPGQNQLFIQGFDTRDHAIPNALRAIRVDFSGADARPEDHLVINEIMYNPAAPDAGYVEIHNTSSTHAFDLSGYRLNGADFSFAEGTLIGPGGFIVLVNDRAAFISAYGPNISIAGQFQGRLDNGGETLKLLKPGSPGGQDLVVSQVTFDDDAPWPGSADGLGASLQLIDPSQDARRVGIGRVHRIPTHNPDGNSPVLAGLQEAFALSLSRFVG